MKRVSPGLLILVTLLFIPATLFAYLRGDFPNVDKTFSGSRLIVKVDGSLNTSLALNKSQVVSIGVPAFDAINREFGVVSQDYLFPPVSIRQYPDLLRNIFIVEVPEAVDIDDLADAYENLPEVVYAEPDITAELYDAPNDPLFLQQWGLHNTGQEHYHIIRYDGCYNDTLGTDFGADDADIDALEVFDNPPDQTVTVVVAIIDSGVDMDHPDLDGRIWINPGEIADNGIDDDHNGHIDDVNGWDFCNRIDGINLGEDNDPTDEHGHGTHCSGIVTAVAGNGEGIAGIVSDCRIMPVKFAPVMLSSLAAKAIVYAADNGADVISMSWGYPWPVRALDNALAYARSKGVILIAAAGNDGAEKSNYPAASAGVITVAASNSDDLITDFSTFGEHVEISAPGLSIVSLRANATDMYSPCEAGIHLVGQRYFLASGTSMACPHVAGVAAYMRAVSPGLTPDATQDLLAFSADDFVDPYGKGENYPGWDKYSGHGRVNLAASLAAVPNVRAKIQSPSANQIVGGTVVVSGIADGNDFSGCVLEYGPGANPTDWIEIASLSQPVTEGVLAQWATENLNGQYTLRLRVGADNISRVTLYVINATVASIQIPGHGDTLVSWSPVIGTACAGDFVNYQLECARLSAPDNWELICESSIPIVDGEVAVWNVSKLSDGDYMLRLSVYASGGLAVADTNQIFVQSLFSTDNGWKVNFDATVTIVPNYGDFNSDGENEVVVGTADSLYFFRADGTPLTSGVPAVPGYNFEMPVAVGKLDDDDIDDLVAVGSWGSDATLFGFRSGAPDFEVIMPMALLSSPGSSNEGMFYPSLVLKDIDNDSIDEIHYYTVSHRYVYNSDGTLRYDLDGQGLSFTPSLFADLDGDGHDELYVTDAYHLYLCDDSGLIVASYEWPPVDDGDFHEESFSGIDIDGDGQLELIVSGYYNGYLGRFWVFAFDEGLSLKPGWPHDTGIDNFVIVSQPVFGDIDTDGGHEYFMTMWELSSAQIFGWHVDGTPYSGDSSSAILATTPNPAIIHAPLLADLNDDGLTDIAANLGSDVFYTYEVERVIAWDYLGEVLPGWPVVTVPDATQPENSGWHSPVIGDINKDGYVDLIVTTLLNDIVFVNFEGVYYRPHAAPVTTWRYNRRMNNIGPVSGGEMTCGDADGDRHINLLDILYLIDYLYGSPQGPAPNPMEAGDANGDGNVDLLDILCLVYYRYGSPPGPDPLCP
ncbi:MAG: S8 family serine peptidase [Candidatus Zixiibacteriota bacterium]|nr:MAG: S8 family serine peptidase [candidate division Zixibacteria bacterium]